MNPLAHIFLTYFVLSFFIPETQKYLLPIAIFANILDIDHIPGIISIAFSKKRKKISKMKPKEYIPKLRSIIQEPVGIIAIELVLLFLYLFLINIII